MTCRFSSRVRGKPCLRLASRAYSLASSNEPLFLSTSTSCAPRACGVNERRAGELLREMEKAQGYKYQSILEPGPSIVKGPILQDLGISYSQSSRWQLEAEVPEEEFERHVAEVKADGETELTSVGLRRLAQKLRQREEAETTQGNVLEFIGDNRKWHTIVIDPPWPIQKILRDKRPNQDIFDYPTMTVEEIGNLPIADLAYPDGCHVYLWVTHKFLPDGLRLFKQWGVKYECLMTWVKNVGFTPFSWMYSTEHVLFGRIGSLPVQKKGLRLDFQAKVEKHSKKPQAFYDLVIQASPSPRLELFAREPREGFEVWGNEIGCQDRLEVGGQPQASNSQRNSPEFLLYPVAETCI